MIAPVDRLHSLALPIVLAAAGGGSSGYGGGGGGGGGGYSGGGGGGSGGGGPWWLWILFAGGAALFLVFGAISGARLRARRRARVARTRAAAAEAMEDDPYFEPDQVVTSAAALFRECQGAWDACDHDRLAELVGEDLMVEWRRRLDDFAAKGWHNAVEVKTGPDVEYVGLVNRADDAEDRVVVRVTATMRDVVETGDGATMNKKGSDSAVVAVAEYWTLARRGDRWMVVSIEQDSEGEHNLDAPLVPSPWSDDERAHDDARVELAQADAAPAGTDVAGLVDLDFADDARAAALDLSLVDDRFSPQVLEVAARRAVAAWAEAVDGDDKALEEMADPAAIRELLHPGDDTARSRLVVRGPKLRALRIVGLDKDADPPAFTVEAELRGRRYVEDRDTLALVRGSRDAEVTFTERWRLALDGAGAVPWRLTAAAAVKP
jgi:predicted lipid-binding transport protein (Tim44 family)